MLPESLFIPAKIEERTIELGDGSKHVLFFRHLPNTAFEKFALWNASNNEDVVASASARLVAMGLCDADGNAVVDAAKAETIKRPVLQRMVSALLEVNGYGPKKKDEPGNA